MRWSVSCSTSMVLLSHLCRELHLLLRSRRSEATPDLTVIYSESPTRRIQPAPTRLMYVKCAPNYQCVGSIDGSFVAVRLSLSGSLLLPLLSLSHLFPPSSRSLSPGTSVARAEHLALNRKWGLRQIHAPLEPVGCSDTCLAHLILNRLKDHVKRNYTAPASSARPRRRRCLLCPDLLWCYYNTRWESEGILQIWFWTKLFFNFSNNS